MASGMRTCPECGAAVSPREAGCPSCGRIFDRGEKLLDRALEVAPRPVEHEGAVEHARSGGTGWTSCLLAGCGCLVASALAAGLFAFLTGSGLREVVEGNRRVQQEAALITLRRALEEFADDHGNRYPERLEQLAEASGGGPWIERLPSDRWGRRFVFEPPPDLERSRGAGRLYSLGRDGEVGGEGEDADLDEATAGIKLTPR